MLRTLSSQAKLRSPVWRIYPSHRDFRSRCPPLAPDSRVAAKACAVLLRVSPLYACLAEQRFTGPFLRLPHSRNSWLLLVAAPCSQAR